MTERSVTSWSDVLARVAGLRSRLLSGEQLRTLARSPDLPALAEGMERAGFPVRVTVLGSSAAALDLAVRRHAGAALRILGRWCGPRTSELAVIFEDEDRRSLRILLRGLIQGVAPTTRLSGLIPTPALPERALEELAEQQSGEALAGLLSIWGSPFGPPLLRELRLVEPDLFRLELLLDRTWAARALGPGRARDPFVRRFARTSIDLANARSALLLVLQGTDVEEESAFLPGGELLSLREFTRAAASGGPDKALELLAKGFTPSSFANVLRTHSDLSTLEEALLAEHASQFVRLARQEPNGLAPVFAYVLRLRKQVIDLRRLVWGVALDVPRPVLSTEMAGGGG